MRVYLIRGFSFCVLVVLTLITLQSHVKAEQPLLSPEDAFVFSIDSTDPNQANLSWQIAPGYYLYQHKFAVNQNNQVLALDLPKAREHVDDNYGHTQIYEQQLSFNIKTLPNQRYQVSFQGCAENRLCYPEQHIDFATDQAGMVQTNQPLTSQKQLFSRADLSQMNGTVQAKSGALARSTSLETAGKAQDQAWTEQLKQRSLLYSALLFLGLGVLLAFTPCSLPMLPILTSLIVRDSRGLKAWMVALSFVVSMALVYALLGLLAASAGLSFQRWLQQPLTLITFSLLFVVFALNLFGVFEVRLPQSLMNRLDQWQSVQKGGTLLGAAVMGVISALLVGPCMTAPLAGTLLFISQTQNQWQGALLLFCLGLGMGLPLFLAAVLGAKVLPKAGLWMNQVKVIFAFIMLGLALYFLRPLLNAYIFQGLSLALGLSFIIYALYRLRARDQLKWLYILIIVIMLPALVFHQFSQYQALPQAQQKGQLNWNVVTDADELEQVLAKAPNDRAIVIDVYADWCVACQPIEHQILKDAQVQQALSAYTLIKLDLSQYDSSHEALLKKWQILGPPTYLFLTPAQQELRTLRLTGAFSKATLLNQLNQLKQ